MNRHMGWGVDITEPADLGKSWPDICHTRALVKRDGVNTEPHVDSFLVSA